MRLRARFVLLAVVAASGAGLAPVPAYGGTYTSIEYSASTDTYTITLVEGGTQVADLDISGNATTWTFTPTYDAAVSWSRTGTSCEQDQTTWVVTCPAASTVVVYGEAYTDGINAKGFGHRVDMYGGTGQDVLTASDVGGWLYGGLDNDAIFGGPADDLMIGGPGDDGLEGRGGRDTLVGGLGGDSLSGGGGADSLRLGGGSDGGDGGSGHDLIFGGAGADLESGGLGRDVVRGDTGADSVSGEGGSDRLYGNGGVDVLFANDQHRDPRIDCGAGDNSQELAHHDRIDPAPISC